MERTELDRILEAHRAWLEDPAMGQRADVVALLERALTSLDQAMVREQDLVRRLSAAEAGLPDQSSDGWAALRLVREYARLTAEIRQRPGRCTGPRPTDESCWLQFCREAEDFMGPRTETFEICLSERPADEFCAACAHWADVQRLQRKRAIAARGNIKRRLVAIGRKEKSRAPGA